MMLDIPSEEAPMEAGIFGKYRESKVGGGRSREPRMDMESRYRKK